MDIAVGASVVILISFTLGVLLVYPAAREAEREAKRLKKANKKLKRSNCKLEKTIGTKKFVQMCKVATPKPRKSQKRYEDKRITWDNNIRRIEYYDPLERLHRNHDPAVQEFVVDAQGKEWLYYQAWCLRDHFHRFGEPARIWFNRKGEIVYSEYWENDVLKKTNDFFSASPVLYSEGKATVWRIFGPKEHGGLLHRTDGPALVNGSRQEWHLHGLLHREDGPAFVSVGGSSYYLNGRSYNKQCWESEVLVRTLVQQQQQMREDFDRAQARNS